MTEQSIKDKYFELLAAYVAQPEEEQLFAASELGRELVLADVPPEDIAEIHGETLERLARECPDMILLDTARLISTPLMELLMAYGLAFRERLEVRRHAEEALQRYVERFRTLRTIDSAILAAWSPEEICHVALRHVRRLVPCLGAGIVTFDFEAQEAVLLTVHVDGDVGLEAGTRFPLQGIADIEALRQGKVLVEEDLLAVPSTSFDYAQGERSGHRAQPSPAIQALQAAGVRSYVAVPLIAQEELIGLLALGAERASAFSTEQVDIAREVADQVAVALHQARLRTALEAEEQRLETLVAHLPEGVLLLDSERRILLANPAAEDHLPALTDATTGDVLTHLADWPVEELIQSPPEGLWRELEVAGPPRRIFGVAVQPVKAEPQPEGWVLLIWDVTQEREVQKRIQQQERLAAVGQLAGGIAHDFNNLLTAIMLYAQMPLRKRDLPPDLARSFETILDESRKATQLVQQILDFSRHAMLKVQPLDLESFTREVIDILRRTIPENIRLTLAMGTEEYVIEADPTRIQQVLMNLATNGRDAMPEGGKLRFELSRVKVQSDEKPPVAEIEPGEWVCLAVSDTGTGMTEEVRSHLFEPFFTTKEPGKGTGLGLAQVYGIVRQHEGYIGMETEVGKGTTFRIYLPASGAEEEVAEEVAASPQGKGETILLVEDNEGVREAGRGILESLGYRVLIASNGREALEICEAVRGIGLVITDVVMPEMGGKELMQELRKVNPGLKALAITGYVVEEDIHTLREEGFLDVVYKPFDLDALAQVVRRTLDAD